MARLVTEHPQAPAGWGVPLVAGPPRTMGRRRGHAIHVPWDPMISGDHAVIEWRGDHLSVRPMNAGGNPVFFQGAACSECSVPLGGHFVLGESVFRVIEERGAPRTPMTPRGGADGPIEEVTFSRQLLQQIQYRDADRRIDILSRLPEILGSADGDEQLLSRLVAVLLSGTAHAEAAAVVSLNASGSKPRVIAWDRRRETAGAFRPSSRLVLESLRHRGTSVLHVWDSPDASLEFTASQDFDWAFCTPVPQTFAKNPTPGTASGDSATLPQITELPSSTTEYLGLYVAGRFDQLSSTPRQSVSGDGPLQADVKFTELVAEFVGASRRLRELERVQAGLRQFFPPVVASAIRSGDSAALLAPRETEVTVLFCDLKGFSRQAEVQRDNLLGLLDRVSIALDVMTRHILEFGGVIGDFQGDAAMGFWGWPVASPDDPIRACRAALAIRREFELAARDPQHALARFESGMGLARGRAVAGKIGTRDHTKVTVFGPVVNLASRLEGMTRQLRVPIVLEESLAQIAREQLSPKDGRVRRLARVLPYGLETPVLASELLPGEAELPDLTAAHLLDYEMAVDRFLEGDWETAYRLLRTMPSSDRAQDVLALQIAQYNRQPPAGWNGVIRFEGK